MDDKKFHEYANIYPLLEAKELADLASSIRGNGLREAIVLHTDGSILDGRNRYLACRTVRVDPRLTTFDGTDEDALEYVIDTNSRRRHLDPSQKAIVAARLLGFTPGGHRSTDGDPQAPHPEAGRSPA